MGCNKVKLIFVTDVEEGVVWLSMYLAYSWMEEYNGEAITSRVGG